MVAVMTMPLLAIDSVDKSFGLVPALRAVSFAVAAREFFALLGPSGCGKTTLLRLIAGFEEPDRGRIRLDGADLAGIRPNRRPINLMFQSYALFPHMSVAGNIAYGLEMEGVRGADLTRRVEEALAMVRLTGEARRKPHQLSGGQRQRVALARALVKRPKLLLLDEPLGALDKKLRGEMQIELKRLQQETGIAFLVVTHDQEEALSLADRIALLEAGRLVQIGTPRELYEKPVNLFAAGFIGDANLLAGKSAAGGIVIPGLGLLPAGNAADIRPGIPAWLMIRPERLRVLSPAGRKPGEGWPGRVAGLAYLGQDAIVHVAIPGLAQPLIARVAAADPIGPHLAQGAEVLCQWPAEQARLLDE